MYRAVTRSIQITVEPSFLADRSSPIDGQYVWAYTVEIVNKGEKPVTLHSRHWRITDANGSLEEVRGPGVVGKTPTIVPGGTFRYTSGCELRTPSGIMVGTYQMSNAEGELFEAAIPAFSLDSPFISRRLN